MLIVSDLRCAYRTLFDRQSRVTANPCFVAFTQVVLKTVDVSYGGENGFNQAIELAAETLGSVKLVQEKKLLQKYFDEISQVCKGR